MWNVDKNEKTLVYVECRKKRKYEKTLFYVLFWVLKKSTTQRRLMPLINAHNNLKVIRILWNHLKSVSNELFWFWEFLFNEKNHTKNKINKHKGYKVVQSTAGYGSNYHLAGSVDVKMSKKIQLRIIYFSMIFLFSILK